MTTNTKTWTAIWADHGQQIGRYDNLEAAKQAVEAETAKLEPGDGSRYTWQDEDGGLSYGNEWHTFAVIAGSPEAAEAIMNQMHDA